MRETALTLFIDLEPDTRIDLETVARTSLAWAQLIKSAGAQVDPFVEWRVELESATPGSQSIRSIISLPDRAELRGMIKGAVFASLLFIFKEAGAWGVGEVMDYLSGPDAPEAVQLLSDQERKELAEEIAALIKAGGGHQDAKKVYDALREDDNVRGAGATSGGRRRPGVIIERNNFPSDADIEAVEEEEQRTTIERLEVTLIRPVLISDSSRRWGFLSKYGSFGAPIRDEGFLRNLAGGRLNVPMVQGIRMLVDLEITERRNGPIWEPVERVIKRVVSVTPPSLQDDLELDQPQ